MISKTVKYYMRSKICTVSSVLFFLIPCGFAVFFWKLGMTGFTLLHTLSRYNFYCCAFLAALSFYFISSADRNHVKEAFECGGKKAVYENHALLFMLVQVLFWNSAMCIILILCSMENDASSYFISWFFAGYLCNMFIPQVICVFLTYLVSASGNPGRMLTPEILFIFLISPFAEEIVWEQKPQFPIDYLWKKIRWPFQILYQNGVWSPDVQNDLQMERVRIYLLVFWLLFLLFLAASCIWNVKPVSAAAGIFAAVFLVLSCQPASVYRLNSSWDGINKDITDYEVHVNDHTLKKPDADIFSITSYQLGMALKNELAVEGNLELEASRKCRDFCMTLYHGYAVKELYANTKGVTVQFKQQNDFIFIHADTAVAKLSIHIQYEGHHNKYYANSCAVMLPGWFPWYPMAGKRQVVLEYPEYGKMWGYSPYNRIKKANISIRTNQAVITNLSDKGGHLYEGTEDSITVLGGNIKKLKDEVAADVLPLQLYAGYGEEEFLAKQKEDYFQSLEKLKNAYGVDVSELEHKRLVFASRDLGRNVTNNHLAVFDSYILAVPNYISADDFLHYLILRDGKNQKRREQSPLIQMVMFSNIDDSAGDIVRQWTEEIRFQNEKPEYMELFMEAAKTCGSERLVKEAVQYALYPQKWESDREFFEMLLNRAEK